MCQTRGSKGESIDDQKFDCNYNYKFFFSQIFEGECIPNLKKLKTQFLSEDDNVYPHAWKGGVGCFTLGLGIMVFTVLLALLTPCCRYCLCCSVFTVSSSTKTSPAKAPLFVFSSAAQSRCSLLSCSPWDCWPTLLAGDQTRSGISVDSRTPSSSAAVRSEEPTGWPWREPSALPWPAPSRSSPTSRPRVVRPPTGGTRAISSSVSLNSLVLPLEISIWC